MKESYGEGPAVHTGPESCAMELRKGVGEALTGVRAGRDIEPRNGLTPGCRRHPQARKAMLKASLRRDAARSRAVKDLAHARKHLAREPGYPMVPCEDGRARREVQGLTPAMNEHGKSDGPVVPAKFPNKVPRSGTAEGMEGRGPAKGNPRRGGIRGHHTKFRRPRRVALAWARRAPLRF